MSHTRSNKFEQVEVEFVDTIVVRRRVKVFVKTGTADDKAIKMAKRELSGLRDAMVDVLSSTHQHDDIKIVGVKPVHGGGKAVQRKQASFIDYEDESVGYHDQRKFFDVSGGDRIDGIYRSARVYECAGQPGLFRISVDEHDWDGRWTYGSGGAVLWPRDSKSYPQLKKLARDFVNRKFTPGPEDLSRFSRK